MIYIYYRSMAVGDGQVDQPDQLWYDEYYKYGPDWSCMVQPGNFQQLYIYKSGSTALRNIT